MEGIILQKASIFQPELVPEYLEEIIKYDILTSYKGLSYCLDSLRRFRKYFELPREVEEEVANYCKKQIRLLEAHYGSKLPPRKEVNKHIEKHLTAMGMALYSRAIDYLKPLKISRIYELQDLYSEVIYPNIKTLDELRANVEKIARTGPFFKAIINPPVPVGSNEVIIAMDYSIADIDKVKDGSGRSISIIAAYDNPHAARVGLRELKKIYPEMLFDELLFIIPMSGEVKDAFEQAENYYLSLRSKRLVEWSTEDMKTLIELRRERNLKLLDFAIPHLQELKIKPEQIEDKIIVEGKLKDYITPINSFDDILTYVKSSSSNHIPFINALFRDKKIKMMFAPTLLTDWLGWKLDEIYNIFRYGVIIGNRDGERVLEDIFQSYENI